MGVQVPPPTPGKPVVQPHGRWRETCDCRRLKASLLVEPRHSVDLRHPVRGHGEILWVPLPDLEDHAAWIANRCLTPSEGQRALRWTHDLDAVRMEHLHSFIEIVDRESQRKGLGALQG